MWWKSFQCILSPPTVIVSLILKGLSYNGDLYKKVLIMVMMVKLIYNDVENKVKVQE